MHRFINTSDDWYKKLKEDLHEGDEFLYECCTLPSCCSRKEACIGIEKLYGVYTLYISGGITCSKRSDENELVLFRQWLNKSKIMFFDFNDLRIFLKSLDILY